MAFYETRVTSNLNESFHRASPLWCSIIEGIFHRKVKHQNPVPCYNPFTGDPGELKFQIYATDRNRGSVYNTVYWLTIKFLNNGRVTVLEQDVPRFQVEFQSFSSPEEASAKFRPKLTESVSIVLSILHPDAHQGAISPHSYHHDPDHENFVSNIGGGGGMNRIRQHHDDQYQQ